jgi:hypothetical protein
MKTNDKEIFDELMRQKLGDYSEEPEMELMGNIHAKKNRLIRLYGLYKMFAVICIIGLGLLSSYLLLKPTEQLRSDKAGSQTEQHIAIQHQESAASDKNVHGDQSAYSQPVSASTSDLHTSTTVSHSGSSANSSVRLTSSSNNKQLKSTTSIVSSDKKSTTSAYKPIINQKEKNTIVTRKIPATSSSSTTIVQNKNTTILTPANKNTDTKGVKEVDAVKEPVKENKDTKDSKDPKATDEKGKDKQIKAECKSAFDFYVSYDGKYNFTNFSEYDPNARLTWDFGDGTQSSSTSPIHVYEHAGNYIVSLQISDSKNTCSDVSHKNIAYNVNSVKKNGISIKGRVIGNSEPINDGRVKLLFFDKEANAFVLLAKSVTSMSGEYSFDRVKAGRYLVLAEGNNNSFIPTYWGNTVNMDEALDINIMENDDDDLLGYNISLYINKAENTSDAAHTPVSDSSGTILLVLDQNNNVITSVKTDRDGNVNLSELPPGDYNILDPSTGASSKIHRDGASNAANTPAPQANKSITLVPNPAVNNFKFELTAPNKSTAEVTIVNSSGSTVYHGNYPCNDGVNLMDVSIYNLPPGVYYVVVSVGGAQTMSGRLIKKASDDGR